jgi:hypothetical protein
MVCASKHDCASKFLWTARKIDVGLFAAIENVGLDIKATTFADMGRFDGEFIHGIDDTSLTTP